MRIRGGEKRRGDACSATPRQQIADDLVGLDRAAFSQVAVHRRALGRTRRGQRFPGTFEEGRGRRLADRAHDADDVVEDTEIE